LFNTLFKDIKILIEESTIEFQNELFKEFDFENKTKQKSNEYQEVNEKKRKYEETTFKENQPLVFGVGNINSEKVKQMNINIQRAQNNKTPVYEVNDENIESNELEEDSGIIEIINGNDLYQKLEKISTLQNNSVDYDNNILTFILKENEDALDLQDESLLLKFKENLNEEKSKCLKIIKAIDDTLNKFSEIEEKMAEKIKNKKKLKKIKKWTF
jgi:hypothetical protein